MTFEGEDRKNNKSAGFDAKKYWELRLESNYGLHGVGYLGLGRYYNNWLYRIRRKAFFKSVSDIRLDSASCSIIDIGSGTGFFVRLWKQLGVKSIVGTDITNISVENLRKDFHSETFYQLDIGEENIQSSPVWNEKYDVASCFDVLYHIIDDERYEIAIKNIYGMLRPGGFFILSDNFVHRTTIRGSNQVSRSLYQIEDIVKRTGFQIISRKPLFFLMNYPVDSDSSIKKKLWNMSVLPATKSEAYGFVIGTILYPVELAMVNLFKESPTTEVMVCRRQ